MTRPLSVFTLSLAALLVVTGVGAGENRESGGRESENAGSPRRSVSLSPSPSAAAAHLRQARALRLRSRQYLESAEAEYRAALRRDPQSLEAERGLARVLRDRGAEEAALPYLRDVAERSREGVDAARLGWALFRAGRWTEAADAFAAARQRGQDDPETRRGEALATAAAGAAVSRDRGAAADAAAVTPAATPPGGWQRAWGTLLNATGVITNTVERLLLGIIALLIVAGVAMRSWGTLMGRGAPKEEEGLRLGQLQGLPVREIDTGRLLGRVRRILYDPKQGQVVGFQTGGWRWRVVPLAAARGVGPAGLLLADAAALVPGCRAPELAALVRSGPLPLGAGGGLKRVVTEDGALVAYTRPSRLWIDGATGNVTFEVTPSRFHDAWRLTLTVLQFGPVDWLMGRLLDWGLELLPGRLSTRVRLPVRLVRSADREVVIVSGETAEWIERHFRQLEAEAQAKLAQVKEGVARARPVVEAGVARARPVVEAGVARARPVLERARDSGMARARPLLERARDAGWGPARPSMGATDAGCKGASAGSELSDTGAPPEAASREDSSPGEAA